MQDTKTLMLKAAVDVVSQAGIRTFSVGKAAVRTGLSRQSIYNAFGSKEEMLRAAMRHSGERKRDAALQAVSETKTIEDQLDVLFEHLVVSAFQFVKSNPSADDFIDSAHKIGGEVLNASFEAERQMYEDVFSPFKFCPCPL